MIKIVLLTLLLLTSSIFASDARLNKYPEAKEWLKDADTNGESAYNIGVLYQQHIEDTKKAIQWYKQAYKMDDKGAAIDASINLASIFDNLKEYKKAEDWYKKGIAKNSSDSNLGLAILYKKLHQYTDAIFYYKKAFTMGNTGGANGLGLLYEQKLKDNKNAELWYKKAAKKGYAKSYKNLALFNHDQGNNIQGAAYFIALIDIKYSKQKVLNYLKNKWKLSDEEIKKAYKLQLTLDIPKHYKGGIN